MQKTKAVKKDGTEIKTKKGEQVFRVALEVGDVFQPLYETPKPLESGGSTLAVNINGANEYVTLTQGQTTCFEKLPKPVMGKTLKCVGYRNKFSKPEMKDFIKFEVV